MRQRGVTVVNVVVTLEVLLVAFLFLLAFGSLSHPHHGHNYQTKCGNNLKQIGLAAIQYSDDKRFFPHLGKMQQLDPGWRSSTATRACRALVYYNYNDNPESFICPSSPDQFTPMTKDAKMDIRAFRWQGAVGPVTAGSPLTPEGVHEKDVPLDKAVDLSYGWTRQGLNTNSSSQKLVAADKSMLLDEDATPASQLAHTDQMIGNHRGCMLAVCVDAHVVSVSRSLDKLNTRTISSSELAEHGFLGVLGDDPALGQ